MEELRELKSKWAEKRPVLWDQIPDIPLYMDQVISYMSRQLMDYEGGEKLTPAMVNNYIKDGLLPRAEGKRYSRRHVAYLTVICMLKQVLSVKETKELLQRMLQEDADVEDLYDSLQTGLDGNMPAAFSQIPDQVDTEQLTKAAFQLALSAYCQQLACKRVLAVLAEQAEPVEEAKREEKTPKKQA